MTGGIGRRCRCRDGNGKELGTKCPKLKNRKHGAWYFQKELPRTASGGRRPPFRRFGYSSKDEAQSDLDSIVALLKLADDDEKDAQLVADMLTALAPGEKLPDPEDIKKQLRVKQPLNSKVTIGEWLDAWYTQFKAKFRQGKIRKNTLVSYESHIRLYLKPKIGHIRRDRLTHDDLVELFNSIADDNDAIVAANADRRALVAQIKATRKRDEKRRLREELAVMPPFRRPASLSSQGRILATLRKSLNDAIAQQKLTFNPAAHYSVGAKRPKPIIWTTERVDKWRETGKRPGPVMVWTPEQAGLFLDYVDEHDPAYAPMWRLMVLRGPRRGETAGLPWTDTNLDESYIDIATQLTEIEYDIAEDTPKSEAGTRRVPLDTETNDGLRRHRVRQNQQRLRLGPAWVESGRVFTQPDGSALRPSWIGDRFEKLYAAAGLPPIRLHDLRHTAATLMLAAGIDMKVIQEVLGHSTLSTTSDVYTSVLPQLAQSAAEATAAIIPRTGGRPHVAEHPQELAGSTRQHTGTPKEHPARSTSIGSSNETIAAG